MTERFHFASHSNIKMNRFDWNRGRLGREHSPGRHEMMANRTVLSRSSSNSNHREGYINSNNPTIASITSAVGNIPRPPVPMVKNERKRAFESARFYSECFMNGIRPSEAELAAKAVNDRYQKWWISTAYSGKGEESGPPEKRPKRNLTTGSKPDASAPDKLVEMSNDLEPSDAVLMSEDEITVSSASRSRQSALSDNEEGTYPIRDLTVGVQVSFHNVSDAKKGIIHTMHVSGGDTSHPEFLSHLEILTSYYASRGLDARWSTRNRLSLELDGMWMMLSKPTFSECRGRNTRGDPLYSLGRLSFDMFRPSGLIASMEGVFNSIQPTKTHLKVCFPSALRDKAESRDNSPRLRNYDIVVALTINAGQTRRGEAVDAECSDKKDDYVVRRPLRCLLTNHGHCLPDPNVPNRLSVWFTGGSLELQDETENMEEWKHLFNQDEVPRRDISELARVLAARVLLGAQIPEGMDEDGTMSYSLRRPIGGHGKVFCDVLYSDENLRIARGHNGTIFVFTKVPNASE